MTDRNDKDYEPTGGTEKQGDARDALVARRNVLFGLWAARELGLPQADREAYALSVHLSDYAEPGRDDVLRKVAADLFAAGRPTPDSRLREVLAEMALRAEVQLDGEGEERP